MLNNITNYDFDTSNYDIDYDTLLNTDIITESSKSIAVPSAFISSTLTFDLDNLKSSSPFLANNLHGANKANLKHLAPRDQQHSALKDLDPHFLRVFFETLLQEAMNTNGETKTALNDPFLYDNDNYDNEPLTINHSLSENKKAISCRLDYPKCLKLLYIDLEINGHSTYGMVDVGSTESIMTLSMSKALGIRIQKVTKPIEAKMANGTIQRYEYAAAVPITCKNHTSTHYFWISNSTITESIVILLGARVICDFQLIPVMHLKQVLSLRDPDDRVILADILEGCGALCTITPKDDTEDNIVYPQTTCRTADEIHLERPKPLRREKHYSVFYPEWKSYVTIKEMRTDPLIRKGNDLRVHWRKPLKSFGGKHQPSGIYKEFFDIHKPQLLNQASSLSLPLLQSITPAEKHKSLYKIYNHYERHPNIPFGNDDDEKNAADGDIHVVPMDDGNTITLQSSPESDSKSDLFYDQYYPDLNIVHVSRSTSEIMKEGVDQYIQRMEDNLNEDDLDHPEDGSNGPEHTVSTVHPELAYAFTELNQLNDSQREDIISILKVNQDLFESDPSRLTKSNLEPLTVHFDEKLKPFQQKSFHLSARENRIIEKQVRDFEMAGVYETSVSDYRSNYFLVTKEIPDSVDKFKLTQEEFEDLRFRGVIDYRELNKFVVDDRQTLPYANEIRDYVTGCHFFTVFDVKNGFLQFLIDTNSREKLAFNAAGRLMQPCVIPQGMKTSPALYQRAIETVLQPLLRKCCLVYMDDAILFSKTWKEHLEHLRLAFAQYRKYNVKLNPLKCKFGLSRVKYLGHIIEAGGARPDPKKIQAINAMKPPTTLKQLQVFLGMINYNQQYIEEWAKKTSPLYDLITDLNSQLKEHPKKAPIYNWTDECQRSFEALQASLASEPFLVHFDPLKDHVVSCDASGYQIGGILKQVEINPLTGKKEHRVVEYFSRKLTPTQQRYNSCEKEFFAIYKSLNHWHHYLWKDKPFIVETDAQAVSYMRKIKRGGLKTPPHSRRLLEWTIALEEYPFDLIHKKGVNNPDADCMSRANIESDSDDLEDYDSTHSISSVMPATPSILSCIFMLKSDSIDELIHRQSLDVFIQDKIDTLLSKTTTVKEYESVLKEYTIISGILYRNIADLNLKEKRSVLVLPESMIIDILEDAHSSLHHGGHLGYHKTLRKIKDKYWFPRMNSIILKFIATCDFCSRNKAKNRSIGMGRPLIFEFEGRSLYPFDFVAIDALDLHNIPSGRFRFALICVDLLTGFVICRPVSSLKYSNVLKFFTEHVFPFGIPLTIVSDNATSFKNIRWNDFCTKLDIRRRYITPYRPSSNGMAERAVRTFKQMATQWCEKNSNKWPDILPAVQLAYNTAIKKSSNYSPHFLLFGHPGRLGIEGDYEIPDGYSPLESLNPMNKDESLEDFMHRIKKHRDEALKNLLATGKKWKQRYDVNRRLSTFRVGDKVVKKIGRIPGGTSHSFFSKYGGPYLVIRVINDLCVEIMDMDGKEKQNIHVDQLKPYSSRDEDEELARLKQLRSDYNDGRSDQDDEETQDPMIDPLDDDNETIIYDPDFDAETDIETLEEEDPAPPVITPKHSGVTDVPGKLYDHKETEHRKRRRKKNKHPGDQQTPLSPIQRRPQTRSRSGITIRRPDKLNLAVVNERI